MYTMTTTAERPKDAYGYEMPLLEKQSLIDSLNNLTIDNNNTKGLEALVKFIPAQEYQSIV